MTLHLEIVTPTKVILKEDDVTGVLAQTSEGEIGILPNHVGLLTKLKPGELIVKRGNKKEAYAILGGFLEVSNNRVNILADYAIRAEDIEIAEAQAAHERAKKILAEKKGNADFVLAEADLRKSILELKIAKKYKPKLGRFS